MHKKQVLDRSSKIKKMIHIHWQEDKIKVHLK